MRRPDWIPYHMWVVLSWISHGSIQALVVLALGTAVGWGALAGWYYREVSQHRGHHIHRWPLDGIADFLSPVLVQVAFVFFF